MSKKLQETLDEYKRGFEELARLMVIQESGLIDFGLYDRLSDVRLPASEEYASAVINQRISELKKGLIEAAKKLGITA